MINKITDTISKPKIHFIYEVLPHWQMQLAIDIGASSGIITKKIRLAGDSSTQVVAFEPFPGNHSFFEEVTDGIGNITLVKKAISDTIGTVEFLVPFVVQGVEKGWEHTTGYSSTGYISEGLNFRKLKFEAWCVLNYFLKKIPLFH